MGLEARMLTIVLCWPLGSVGGIGADHSLMDAYYPVRFLIDRNNCFQSSHRSSALVSATLTFDDGLFYLSTFLVLFSKLKRIFLFSSLFLCAQLKKLFFLSLFSLCPFSLLELSNQTRTATLQL